MVFYERDGLPVRRGTRRDVSKNVNPEYATGEFMKFRHLDSRDFNDGRAARRVKIWPRGIPARTGTANKNRGVRGGIYYVSYYLGLLKREQFTKTSFEKKKRRRTHANVRARRYGKKAPSRGKSN